MELEQQGQGHRRIGGAVRQGPREQAGRRAGAALLCAWFLDSLAATPLGHLINCRRFRMMTDREMDSTKRDELYFLMAEGSIEEDDIFAQHSTAAPDAFFT